MQLLTVNDVAQRDNQASDKRDELTKEVVGEIVHWELATSQWSTEGGCSLCLRPHSHSGQTMVAT